MINEISVKPKPQNNNAKIIFSITLIASALIFVTSMIIPVYKGIVGFVGMLGLVSSILIYTKYISPEFRYDVTFDRDERAVFIVRQLIGKRETTLCRIFLSDIVKLDRETREQQKGHKTEKGTALYNYNPTVMPDVVYRITALCEGERSEIVIELSDEIAQLFSSYVSEARKSEGKEE